MSITVSKLWGAFLLHFNFIQYTSFRCIFSQLTKQIGNIPSPQPGLFIVSENTALSTETPVPHIYDKTTPRSDARRKNCEIWIPSTSSIFWNVDSLSSIIYSRKKCFKNLIPKKTKKSPKAEQKIASASSTRSGQVRSGWGQWGQALRKVHQSNQERARAQESPPSHFLVVHPLH